MRRGAEPSLAAHGVELASTAIERGAQSRLFAAYGFVALSNVLNMSSIVVRSLALA